MWELRLCSNGSYYLWENNDLYIMDNGDYIHFDSFNKYDAEDLINILNKKEKTNREVGLKLKEIKHLRKQNTELKKLLNSILLSVKREGFHAEMNISVNPNSYELISDTLRYYGD